MANVLAEWMIQEEDWMSALRHFIVDESMKMLFSRISR
jgi:hypothetical protein